MAGGSIAVFGVGNVLLSDDAIGPWVVRQLEAGWQFPDNVVVEDLGTPGLELSSHLGGNRDCVIFIDAVASEDPPGSIHVYDREAILRHPAGIRLSPHDPSLKETILAMDLAGDGPKDVRLIGIVPLTTAPAIGLSPRVREAVPRAVATVIDLLDELGAAAERKNGGGDTAPPWWESPADQLLT
jgi:hydrogenase maturation protease